MHTSATLLMIGVMALEGAASSHPGLERVEQLSERVDQLMEQHWQRSGVYPADAAQDAVFLRRVTLDLVGRIPTYAEALAFARDTSANKRHAAIDRLMRSPEYPLHLGNVLDGIIQGEHAGDRAFIGYLRQSVGKGKGWDRMFREMLLGPWDSDELKPAASYIEKRIRTLDDLTSDTSRVFFGVEIACAKCHDHPLVPDWTQHHYYGMASFFNRTYPFGKDRTIGEKDSDDVTFVDRKGNQHTARMMFLSGELVAEPRFVVDPKLKDLKERYKKEGKYLAPPFSRREQLVSVALNQQQFFSRAVVNQLWAFLFGRGLVEPVDQMHSENPPSVPAVLDLLAEDLAAQGYNLNRTVAAMAGTRTYQLAGTWQSAGEPPDDEYFARAKLRALTPKQFALSAVLATGDQSLDQADAPEQRADRYLALENQSRELIESLDERTASFQASATEALYMSNHPAVQRLVEPAGNNLAARLAATEDADQRIETAYYTVLSRAPDAEERRHLGDYFQSAEDLPAACSRLVWALLTSAEFRFNH